MKHYPRRHGHLLCDVGEGIKPVPMFFSVFVQTVNLYKFLFGFGFVVRLYNI